MAPTHEACVAMVKTCRQAGGRLLIHENWRWQPWYREIKRLLGEGEIGILFHLAFRPRAGAACYQSAESQQPVFLND